MTLEERVRQLEQDVRCLTTALASTGAASVAMAEAIQDRRAELDAAEMDREDVA